MTNFRSRKDGRHYPVRHSIYSAPRDKTLANEVRGKNVEEARGSVAKLGKDFDNAKERSKKERIYHATLEEANRAEISSNNPRNGTEARMRQREVEVIFRKEADRMHGELY